MVSTIALCDEMKEKLRNLGKAGETYEDVIKRIYEITTQNMLLTYLYDKTDVPITQALEEAKKKWSNRI